MSVVYTGTKSRIFGGIEASKNGGFAGSPIPLNLNQGFSPPEVKPTEAEETTSDKHTPNIVWTSEITPGEVTFDNTFWDPFWMATFFTHKEESGTWTGVGYGKLAFDFSECDHVDTVWFQRRLAPGCNSNPMSDELYYGGLPMSYHLIQEKDKLMHEVMTFKMTHAKRVLHDMQSTLFDDGTWDETGAIQVQDITCQAKADYTAKDYFYIYAADGSGNQTKFYVWFNVGGADTSPHLVSTTEIYKKINTYGETWTGLECDISGAGDSTTVAVIVAAAIDGNAAFGAANTLAVVRVTDVNNGRVWSSEDVNAGDTHTVITNGALLTGGWGSWDNSGLNGTGKRGAPDVRLDFDDVEYADLHIQSFDVGWDGEQNTDRPASSYNHTLSWQGVRNFKITITGKMNNPNYLKQLYKYHQDKDKKTAKFYYDTTTNETKFIQMTNMYLSSESNLPPTPAAGESVEVTLVFKGDNCVCSHESNYLHAQTPVTMINCDEI